MWHFHSIPDKIPPFVSFWDISRCHESEADMQQNVSVRRTPPAEEKRMQCQLLPATSQTIPDAAYIHEISRGNSMALFRQYKPRFTGP